MAKIDTGNFGYATARVGRAPVAQDVSGGAFQATQRLAATAQGMATQALDEEVRQSDAAAVLAAGRKLDDWERDAVFDPEKGAIARRGADSFDLPKTLVSSFDSAASSIEKDLKTERQKLAFGQMMASRRQQVGAFADRHALQERKAYEEGQFQAGIGSSLDRAALLVANDELDASAAEVATAQSRATGRLRSLGRSEEEIGATVKGIGSKAATTTINLLLERNLPMKAQTYLAANAGRMNADDLLTTSLAVKKASAAAIGLAAADDVLRTDFEPSVAPTAMDRLSAIVGPVDMGKLTGVVEGIESRGRDFGADGQILTSPKGAQGRMQVMPGTQTDPGFGVRPAADNTPAEIARVGRDYLAAMVKRYDGDVAKAAAAYNWGPGAVDKAVKAAQENAGRGEQVPADAWLASAPVETRTYVSNVLRQMSDSQASAPQRPTLEQLQRTVRERLGPAAADPIAVKSAVDRITHEFDARTKAIAQRKDELVASAYTALTANGGRFSDLPAAMRSTLMRDAPDKIDELQNFGVRFAKGDDVTDDRLYLRLSDPRVLSGLSDAQFMALRGGLSQSDFQQFIRQRTEIRMGKTGDTAGDLNTAAVGRFLTNRLQGMGIDPTPKDGGNDAQRVGAIRRFVDSSLLDAQRAAGKKFSDTEVQQHVDGLFAQNQTFRGSFLGVPTGNSSQTMLGMKYGDIPSADRKLIERAFKEQGNANPTQADVLGAYWAGKMQARRGATGNF